MWQGQWLNPPPAAERDGADLVVTAGPGTDFWRTTSYGFVHDDGHALLAPLPPGSAVEVTFVAAFTEQFDQAGLMVRVDAETWVKAGVEHSDGAPQLGAVVTHAMSDWSLAPVPHWAGRAVTVRASRAGDALTIRARVDGEPWQMVRVAPLDPNVEAHAGPMCCAPSRAATGAPLRVRFTGWTTGPADTALH